MTNSSSLLIALNIVSDSRAVSPQTREVGQLLARIAPGLAIVETDENIVVSNYLVLHVRHRALSPVAQRLLNEVLRRL